MRKHSRKKTQMERRRWIEVKGEQEGRKERVETIDGAKAEDWRSRVVCPQRNRKRASITTNRVKHTAKRCEAMSNGLARILRTFAVEFAE